MVIVSCYLIMSEGLCVEWTQTDLRVEVSTAKSTGPLQEGMLVTEHSSRASPVKGASST